MLKPHITVLKKKKVSIKYLLILFCYTHRSLSCSVISREASPAVHEEKYRDPQPDIMCRVGDLGTLSPKWSTSIKSPLLRHRELCGEKRQKEYLSQRGWRILIKQGSLNQHDRCTFELSEKWQQHEQGLHCLRS